MTLNKGEVLFGFEPSLHNRGEGILVHAASGHARDFLELSHQTGDYRVLFLKEIQLRIGRVPTAAGCRSGWKRRRDGGSLEGRALRASFGLERQFQEGRQIPA